MAIQKRITSRAHGARQDSRWSWTAKAVVPGALALFALFALTPGDFPLRTANGADELTDPDALLIGDDLLAEPDGDDLLADTDDDDLLSDEPADAAATESEPVEPTPGEAAAQSHADLFLEDRYPSANTCATCHPRQYDQWSVSQHAYAQLSPVFLAMQNTINQRTSSTNGDFCIRCHNQVGMNLGESIFASNLDRHPTSREGITCAVCHRVENPYGKVSGRLALAEGDLLSPVYGPSGSDELQRVIDTPKDYRVVTEPGESGRQIHTEARKLGQMSTSAFCGACHDVTLHNGFRLEEAFAEYQQSPAARNGVTCQDCHMGKTQGKAEGYEHGPAAIVGGVPTKDRRLTNHYFAGPDYSIIHPGLFPLSVEASEFKTMREWLTFDHEAGWGTDEFEDEVADDFPFGDAWSSVDDRYDAREILNKQFERLEWARQQRQEVLQNGFGLGDITVERADRRGIRFAVEVKNLTDGHGVPTGFDAERVIFLAVTVTDREGTVVYQSGDRDPNGDLRDAHSLYVHNGELPQDRDLFSLQSKFIVRLLRGGEREQVLAVNKSPSVLSFVRPETRATVIYGRPRGARKHKQNIEALGRRIARYSVPAEDLDGKGPYTANVKLIAQMVPVNLIHEIQGVGFDYNMSPKAIADAVVEGAHVVWEKDVAIPLDGSVVETARR